MSAGRFFVGIGGQRCGTSWLFDHLARHPEVSAPPVKELHVFDRLFVDERLTGAGARATRILDAAPPDDAATSALHDLEHVVAAADLDTSLARYREWFTRWVDDTKTFGEITPTYQLLPPAGFDAITRAFPAARFVFVLRDPLDRFRSAVWKLPAVTDADLARLWFGRRVRHPGWRARSRYDATLTALAGSVPAEQVLTLFYEDLLQPGDHSAIDALHRFLDLAPHPASIGRKIAPSPQFELPRELRVEAAELLLPVYDEVEARLGTLPPRWYEQRARLAAR